MMPQDMRVFFPEPKKSNTYWAGNGEPTLNWIRKSTVDRAVLARRFLNENLSKLPQAGQESIYNRLLADWDRGFFELVVGRLLQVIGGTLEVEPELPDGHRPDFRAEFAQSAVVVEAVKPVINSDELGREGRAQLLLRLIENWIPAGWGMLVYALPDINPSESKAEIRRLINNLFATHDSAEDVELDKETPNGRLHIGFTRKYGDDPRVHFKTGGVVWDNTEIRIQHAVRQKRRQVRASSDPVILAIDAGCFGVSTFENFNIALFGRTSAFYDPQLDILVPQEFSASGVFCEQRSGPPTFAGALAFVGTGFAMSTAPILYMHPRFEGVLPDEMTTFARRRFVGGIKGIAATVAENESVMERLNFVKI